MKRNWKLKLIAVSSGLLVIGVLFGHRPIFTGIGRWLVAETELRKVDLVVALGGSRRRQEEAVKLLNKGMGRSVLFVGHDFRSRDYQCLGVPAEQAIPPPAPSYTTYDEAIVTRTVVKGRDLKSVLVVTSPFHLRRARWTFQRVFEETGVVLLFSSASDPSILIENWWKSYIGRKQVFMEFLGLAFYWLTV